MHSTSLILSWFHWSTYVYGFEDATWFHDFANRQSSVNSEDEGSDWTWETCSDSDPEGVDSASISTTKTTRTTSTSTPTPAAVSKEPAPTIKGAYSSGPNSSKVFYTSKDSKHLLSLCLYYTFWQILISYSKFLMPRPLKWGVLKVRLSQNEFMKSSILQNSNWKIWRISALASKTRSNKKKSI